MVKKLHVVVLKKKSLFMGFFSLAACLAVILIVTFFAGNSQTTFGQSNGGYVILGENNLGMHCYNNDFSSYMIIPPGNTLKVQIFKKGTDSAKLINSGITVSYEIINNTSSADKTNFWQYAKDYGYDIAPNIGITGNGMKGNFTLSPDGKYYEAAFIPVTPYNDAGGKLNPYQMAHIKVTDSKTGKILASTNSIVVPVSNEMLCSTCHGKNQTDLNLLSSHDKLSKTSLVADLNKGIRHKCGDCHKDNGLGLPGKMGIKPLSQAIHGFHASKMSQSSITPSCYSCHPGPVTQCYRGYMSMVGIGCEDPRCHGDMANLASTQANGREAWLQEPDCANCHEKAYAVNPGMLYRDSYLQNGPGGQMADIQCESCHNSPHAIWPSINPADNLLPQSLQGYAGIIGKCEVCHAGQGLIHNP